MNPVALNLLLFAALLFASYLLASWLIRSAIRYQKQRDAIRLEIEWIRTHSINRATPKVDYARTQDTTSKPERPTTNYRRQHRDSR